MYSLISIEKYTYNTLNNIYMYIILYIYMLSVVYNVFGILLIYIRQDPDYCKFTKLWLCGIIT